MASRVEQMETHLIQANEEQIKPTRDHMSRDWISQISDELIQRMNSVTTTKPSSKSSSIERPKCVRCNGDVTVMERILVQGDTLHRSVQRYSRVFTMFIILILCFLWQVVSHVSTLRSNIEVGRSAIQQHRLYVLRLCRKQQ